ncbi:MAG TPA: DNA-directed RNA polymerase subunit beta', partial [Candidatus Syntrophosphaera thermopropionivorans]|nr:DNA-directed RNA polymerase subunit beta' [Candidatus Syntrophosphaera thermopropionivorans]
MLKESKHDIKPNEYDSVRIKIASPETIRNEWSYGEVTKPDTLNYRTLKPEKDGLFCERIFGPERDYECACGKYKKKRFQGTVCDRCGVLVTTSRVRRTRMGHIDLAVPIAHIWFVKSAPSKIGTLLDMTVKDLERVLYYESFIVIDPGDSPFEKMELLEVDEYYEIKDKVADNFLALMGGEAIRELLKRINLKNEALDLRTRLKFEESALRKQKLINKLKIVDAFIKSGNRPEDMILETLPVLPPTLRPLVPLEGGRFATADFNDLYRRVITRNNRLKALLE